MKKKLMLKRNKFLITNYSYKFYALVFTSTKFTKLTYLYFFQRFFFFFRLFDSVIYKYFILNFCLYNYVINHYHGNLHFIKPLTIILSNIQRMPIYLNFFKSYMLLKNKDFDENINSLVFFFHFKNIYKNSFIFYKLEKPHHFSYNFNWICGYNFRKFFYVFFVYIVFLESLMLS